MQVENEALVLDLVEWIAGQPRAYHEVMEAWRTSCPRLTIWEDAIDAGFVSVASDGGSGKTVSVTGKGREFLEKAGRTAG